MATFRRWAGLAVPLLLAGCATWRPAVVPMRTLFEPARCTAPAGTLLVMLPGSYSLPEEFQSEGFVRIARAHRMAADLRLVDAHVRYYQNRSVIERLAEDVIRPARAQGYRQICRSGSWASRSARSVQCCMPMRFRFNDEVLRAALPASRVFTAPGGHDWQAWRTVWDRIASVLPVLIDANCPAD